MKLSDIKVLIIEDNIYKLVDIKKALSYSGIDKTNIIHASNQEAGFEKIYESIEQNTPLSLIVTDMNYSIKKGGPTDKKAGFKLIDKLKEEEINIPIIICSSINYVDPDILGCVWYNKLRDLNFEFKKIIDKIT